MDFPFKFWLKVLSPYEFWTLFESEALLKGYAYTPISFSVFDGTAYPTD